MLSNAANDSLQEISNKLSVSTVTYDSEIEENKKRTAKFLNYLNDSLAADSQ